MEKIEALNNKLSKTKTLLSPRSTVDESKPYNKGGIKPNYNKPKNSTEILKLEEKTLRAFDEGDLDFYLQSSDELDYPCNDNSTNITDFRSWSYFKKRTQRYSETKIHNIGHSTLWSKECIQRIANHNKYIMIKEQPVLSVAKQSKLMRERQKRAKSDLMKWKKRVEKEGIYAQGKTTISKVTASENASATSTEAIYNSNIALGARKVTNNKSGRDKSPGRDKSSPKRS